MNHKKSFQFFRPPDTKNALRELRSRQPSHWEHEGEKMALRLFDFTSRKVPAYRSFLKKHGVNPRKIKTIADFKTLPVMDKASYLRKYEYLDLFPNRDISSATTISATSGSSGEPFYFPRGEEQDAQYEYTAEILLKNQFEIDKNSTLGIIGFALGIWIGGIFTYKNLNKIASKGYPLSLTPVGPNIHFYLPVIKKFGGYFDQIILMGYPPFIKDVIDSANQYGVDWKKYRVKILTATEAFSEGFRDYVAKHAHVRNPLTDIVNIYGTVELGTMAYETPLANLIRKFTNNNKKIAKEIFPLGSHNRMPTLAQYYPYFTYFEEINGEVIGSGYGSVFPLLRYSFPDRGGVISFDDMLERLRRAGINIFDFAKSEKITKTVLKLPFVYVYDREGNSLVVRGANIYAEHVRTAMNAKLFASFITGKFSMVKKEDRKKNEYFELHVELRRGRRVDRMLQKKIQDEVVKTLRRLNSEYNDQFQTAPHVMTPPIILHPYQDSAYFQPGVKQKWVKR